MIAAFTIPGEPASKARPRFTKRGSKVQAYTPERTHEAEEIVGWRFRASAPGHKPDSENAYRVDATFISGSFQRRDLDNMLKLILDSLNKVAWDDDNQVVAISGTKRVETPGSARTEVTVSTVGPLERSRTQECPACGKRFACHPSTKQQRVYCSRECQASAGRTKVRCARCDIEFTKQNCYVRPLNYCSKECRNKNSLSSQASQWKCEECGGALSKPQYRKCRNCFLGYCGEPGAMLPLSAGLEPVSVPPRTPSALRVEEFIRLRVAGGTVVAAAEALGVTRRTGTRYEGLRKARALAETKRGRAA